MNIINPKTLNIVHGLPRFAIKGDKISVDSEFFGQDKKRLHRPHGQFAWLGCSFDGITIYYITDETQIQEFFDRLDAGVLIFHHAKYDVSQLRRFASIPDRKLLWDTMLIEQIMFSGFYSEFSLADLARRYLDVYMEKETRKEFSHTNKPKNLEEIALAMDEFDHMNDYPNKITSKQIEYASIDVVATWKIYQAQRSIIDETDLQIWKEIELPFLWTILSMGGVKLDQEKWMTLAKKNEVSAKEIQDKYNPLNLNSPKQVKEYFKAQYGIKTESTDVEFLESHQDIEFAQDMLVYRNCSKRASTYGAKFIEDYVEADGKIYADLYQIGAETARTSCRAPNLQNQPHEFEYRDCFVADEGNCMVVADWGSQEPRIAAYLSQDKKLIEALNGTEKLYIAVARDVLGKTIKKESPEYTHIKSTVLGIFYGMSAVGLSKRIGVSKEEAQDMIDAFLETYPGVREYMYRQKQAKDYVTSIYGRKIWLNKYSYQWERNALNAPIQSSAADAMKLAASRFTQNWKRDINPSPLRLLVHDEICLEVPKMWVDVTKNLLEKYMVEVSEEMHDGVRGIAEVYVGTSWAAKH